MFKIILGVIMKTSLVVILSSLVFRLIVGATVTSKPHRSRFRINSLFRAKDISGTPPTPVSGKLHKVVPPKCAEMSINVIIHCDLHLKRCITEEEVATALGYKGETHTVRTPDGYLLGIHRVLNYSAIKRYNRPEPFILQHGLLCNSGQWLILEPKQNLALMLADAGYDVWLTNIRGNMYSRKRERLSPDNIEFWDYGFHEHGTIDMPAIIDYILGRTGYKQLWYAGHSMGSTMFFIMTSLKPEYNDKIRHMFALAPVAYMGHAQSPAIQISAPGIRRYQELMRTTLNNHIPADMIVLQLGKMGVCSVTQATCGRVADSVMGYNPRSNATVQEALFRYIPDVASMKQLAHYAQCFNNPDTFRLFDYYEQNMAIYKSPTPPDYPVHKIRAPMTFLYSENDLLAATQDVEKFSLKLKNVRLFLISDKNFNHMDFIIATYANELVYIPMMQIMDNIRDNV